MRTLVDIIEHHIRSLIEQSAEGAIAIQRAELAEHFRCVPSQISYVIDTRFTPDRGYVVESRRGGGGYIRIVRVATRGKGAELLKVLAGEIGEYIDQRRAENIIERLRDDGLIDDREAALMRGAVRRESIPVHLPLRDALRAKIFYNMLTALVGTGSARPGDAGGPGNDGSAGNPHSPNRPGAASAARQPHKTQAQRGDQRQDQRQDQRGQLRQPSQRGRKA